MKRLANNEEALENLKALLKSEIDIETLYDFLDEAEKSLCQYMLTSDNFSGHERAHDPVYGIMLIKSVLLTEKKPLSKAS